MPNEKIATGNGLAFALTPGIGARNSSRWSGGGQGRHTVTHSELDRARHGQQTVRSMPSRKPVATPVNVAAADVSGRVAGLELLLILPR